MLKNTNEVILKGTKSSGYTSWKMFCRLTGHKKGDTFLVRICHNYGDQICCNSKDGQTYFFKK